MWLGMGGVGTCDTKKNLTIFFLPFFYSLFFFFFKFIKRWAGALHQPQWKSWKVLLPSELLAFSLESGYQKLVIKGDSELMIGALRCGGWKNSHIGHLINDILFSINSFQSISFSHVVQ